MVTQMTAYCKPFFEKKKRAEIIVLQDLKPLAAGFRIQMQDAEDLFTFHSCSVLPGLCRPVAKTQRVFRWRVANVDASETTELYFY